MAGPDDDRATGPAPWWVLVRWALVGTAVLLVLVGIDYQRYGGSNPVSLLQPGADATTAPLIERDFPGTVLPSQGGLDGQEFYAIARDPLHLDRTAENLDRPQYRLQRPLLSWLAWALHPGGGGDGLIWALALVVLAGCAAGSLATGYLSWRWGGPAWLGVLFPILPGAWWSLRTTVSDALALALALTAIALATRGHQRWAVAVGVAAVLAKEPVVLVLGGWWLATRTRRDLRLVVIPAAAAAAWGLWLRIQLPPDPDVTRDLTVPFVGLVQAWGDYWSRGSQLVAMVSMVGGLVLAAVTLWRRGLRHPLGWAIAVQVGFLLCIGINPTAMNAGGPRMAMPVTVLCVVALATPRARLVPRSGGGGRSVEVVRRAGAMPAEPAAPEVVQVA